MSEKELLPCSCGETDRIQYQFPTIDTVIYVYVFCSNCKNKTTEIAQTKTSIQFVKELWNTTVRFDRTYIKFPTDEQLEKSFKTHGRRIYINLKRVSELLGDSNSFTQGLVDACLDLLERPDL